MTQQDTEIAVDDDPSLGAHRKRRRRWWHRHLESEERQRVMTELAIKRQDHNAFRFGLMIALSVIVAVMGMSADSAAVVIGAMLLAPLMQPVLATAACIAMALFRRAATAFGVVLLATVGSVVLAYVLSALFVNGELPDEVTSRTAPGHPRPGGGARCGHGRRLRHRSQGRVGVAAGRGGGRRARAPARSHRDLDGSGQCHVRLGCGAAVHHQPDRHRVRRGGGVRGHRVRAAPPSRQHVPPFVARRGHRRGVRRGDRAAALRRIDLGGRAVRAGTRSVGDRVGLARSDRPTFGPAGVVRRRSHHGVGPQFRHRAGPPTAPRRDGDGVR